MTTVFGRCDKSGSAICGSGDTGAIKLLVVAVFSSWMVPGMPMLLVVVCDHKCWSRASDYQPLIDASAEMNELPFRESDTSTGEMRDLLLESTMAYWIRECGEE